MAAFKVSDMKRKRTLGWDGKANDGRGGAITTSDAMNDDGSINMEFCKAHGINPAAVTYITVNDLHGDYANGAKSALSRLAAEWSTEKVKWTPDDVAHYLAINARLQDAANESVKQHRPLTDKAVDRATSTMFKYVKGQNAGLSDMEIKAKLATLGLKM